MREADEGGGAGDVGEAGERGEDLRSGGTARRNNSRRWGRAARKARSMGGGGGYGRGACVSAEVEDRRVTLRDGADARPHDGGAKRMRMACGGNDVGEGG